ncbi:MAG: cobalamin biosynthesis protein [Methanobacteriaceae archaeon]|nr:cobalamin biosynthesis protein [Methanobacteriaceae archaeon]
MLLTIMIFSLALDLVISELPVKIHPVVWIGKVISFFKNKFISMDNKLSGVLVAICVVIFSLLIVIIPLALIKHFLYLNVNMIYLFKLVAVILLFSSFSVKLLLDSARDIASTLESNNIKKARESVSYLVSRNTNDLTKEEIISASIETLTENLPDSYISTMFYYLIVGIICSIIGLNDFTVIIIAISAAFVHRSIDTLDSMLGYKTKELANIGWFSAKADDVLNYIPARFSAIIIVVASLILRFDWRNAYIIMMRDAKNLESPNSGYPMAATAGALNIQLVKKGHYILGDKTNNLKVDDIKKAIDITRFSIFLFTAFFIFVLLDLILIML